MVLEAVAFDGPLEAVVADGSPLVAMERFESSGVGGGAVRQAQITVVGGGEDQRGCFTGQRAFGVASTVCEPHLDLEPLADQICGWMVGRTRSRRRWFPGAYSR